MSRVVEKRAPAKINLYLHVHGKRSDGYHLLDSLVVFADNAADTITVTEAPRFSFSLSGPFAQTLESEDADRNLAVRAARLYAEKTGMPLSFALSLEKNLPPGAGLGGGSADAAAVIHALEEFYKKAMPGRDTALLTLGADVPVCYHGKSCRFEGIGDVITHVPAPPALPVLLLWPGKHTATKDVFGALRKEYRPQKTHIPKSFGRSQLFLEFLNTTDNDLAAAARSITPEIEEAEKALKEREGCVFARMSGSGSAVFGIFDTMENCTKAGTYIQAQKPGWWVTTA